jgi:hypothetical protein
MGADKNSSQRTRLMSQSQSSRLRNIEELLTFGTILGSPSGSTNQGTKANQTTPNQTGSP